MKLTPAMCLDQFTALPIEEQRWIITITQELQSAREKHPNWPKDLIHRAAIVGEEAGELLQAALQYKYEKGQYYKQHVEAMHTAATCLRFLVETPEKKLRA